MGFGSPWHWLVIGIVALLLFGNRLPEVARSVGKAFREFKKGLSDVSDEIDRAGREPDRPPERLSPPGERSDSKRFNEPNDTPEEKRSVEASRESKE